ncbi:ATP-grasp domain-containing protein [Neohortaea acidophila]|uniref:Succinate--CoA ligase [ADP-forming] subunit beta, mitochondrial n=1 Tax=Neohortaea acidophila TaxID=245834 RepID=A0A6A6PM48_9PEZI|nr:ATP-grasp domain-containing protein [Neohortaea acidophila]KAF2480734.1 ATP-grasp domain-containing protein [Neohortaea acidophila]
MFQTPSSSFIRGARALTQRQRSRLPQRQVRQLSLHEYQSQNLLKEYDVPVPRGILARTPKEVADAVTKLGGKCVVKSQVLKGGRGKGRFDSGLQGGIQVVDDASSAEKLAAQMLGHRLITKQTDEKGLSVNKLYVAETIKYDDEWYLAMTIDRENYSPAIIVSKAGGMDIETVAKEHPDQLLTFHFSISQGITPDLVKRLSSALKTSEKETKNLETILTRMHKVFTAKDATLLEINPLVRSSDGNFTCLDAKFSFDDAASPRQKELFALRDSDDIEQDQSTEMEAKEYDLVYIRLDGNIGNVVNGAGLAMATNDAIAYHGGSSANFLDAGGQATQQTMQKAFEIILRDERVKCILVNIYGGIIRCDMIAESIIGAAKELGSFRVPIVVRLQGTNSAEGLKLVSSSLLFSVVPH